MGYDVFFIEYEEPNADSHFVWAQQIIPWIQRISNVTGIREAHSIAAAKSRTRYFVTIDADNKIIPEAIYDELFGFVHLPENEKFVHVFEALNPVNNLCYGWGGIKIWPVELFGNLQDDYIDFTFSTGPVITVKKTLSVTHFNSSPWNTWRSAYREAFKLQLSYNREQDHKKQKIILDRLETWCNVANPAAMFGGYSTAGALQGRAIALTSPLPNINDYAWLKNEFSKVMI